MQPCVCGEPGGSEDNDCKSRDVGVLPPSRRLSNPVTGTGPILMCAACVLNSDSGCSVLISDSMCLFCPGSVKRGTYEP